MFPKYIETDRLILEPAYKKMNSKKFYSYCSNNIDNVTKYLNWNKHSNILESMQVLSEFRNDWFDCKCAHYYIEHKENNDFIGLCSLSIDYDKKQGEIGIWLREKYWGKRYSEERAYALIEIGLNELNLSSIIFKVHHKNKKSKKAVNRYITNIGGKKYGEIPDGHVCKDGAEDAVLYGIKKLNYNNSSTPIRDYRW